MNITYFKQKIKRLKKSKKYTDWQKEKYIKRCRNKIKKLRILHKKKPKIR